IFNAAREPHVQDLCGLLVKMGAHIEGIGTERLIVDGTQELGGAEHTVVADYLEAGTYAIAAAAAGGNLRIECSRPQDLELLLLKLEQAGAHVEAGDGWFRVGRETRTPIQPIDMSTWTFPGFPTDLQAQYMALMTKADARASSPSTFTRIASSTCASWPRWAPRSPSRAGCTRTCTGPAGCAELRSRSPTSAPARPSSSRRCALRGTASCATRGTSSAVTRTWWASWRRQEPGSKRSAWISKRRVVTALTSDVDILPEDRDRPRHLDRAHLRQGRRHRRERTVPRGRQSRQSAT